MVRINIQNTTRAKGLIKFCLSHRDVARVLIFCIPQYKDNGKTYREFSVQLHTVTFLELNIIFVITSTYDIFLNVIFKVLLTSQQ